MGCGSSSTTVGRFHMPITPPFTPHDATLYTPVQRMTDPADSDDEPPSYQQQLSRHLSEINPDCDEVQPYTGSYEVPPLPSSPPPPYTVLPDENHTRTLWHSSWDSNHDGSSLSPKDITRHNQNNCFRYISYWQAWKGKVYDTCALYNHFKPKIEALMEVDASLEAKRWHLEQDPKHLIINLPSCGIKKVERDQVMEIYFVAPLSSISATEKLENWKQDLDKLKSSLSNGEPGESSDTSSLVIKICERELKHLQKPTKAKGIFNDSYFRLPRGVRENSLRHYLKNGKKFNFDIDDHGYAWKPPIKTQNLIGDHVCLEDNLRVWLKDWRSFDLVVDGEASWNVIPLNILKNDVTTPLQEEIHESRAQRTDLWNDVSMANRRDAIADYFVFAYEYDRRYIACFLRWAETMEMSAIDFEGLCDEYY